MLIKDTSLLSTHHRVRIHQRGHLLNSERVKPNESFITIALGYLAIYGVILLLARMVKRRLAGPAWNAQG